MGQYNVIVATWNYIATLHYNDVIMGAIASQITSLTIIYSTVYSGADHRKRQSSALLALCAGNSPVTGEFPAQRASYAENLSIWWRHHESIYPPLFPISLTKPDSYTEIKLDRLERLRSDPRRPMNTHPSYRSIHIGFL